MTRPWRRDPTTQCPTGLDRALDKLNEGRVLERFFVRTWADHQCPGREDKCTSLATADGHVKLSHTVCAAEQGGRVVEKPETGPVNHGCTLAPKQGSIFCKEHHELFAVEVSAARAARAEKKRVVAAKRAKALRAAQGAPAPLAEARHQCVNTCFVQPPGRLSKNIFPWIHHQNHNHRAGGGVCGGRRRRWRAGT